MRRWTGIIAGSCLAAALLLAGHGGCDCGGGTASGTPCLTQDDCPAGQMCLDGFCRALDGSPGDGEGGTDGEDGDESGEGADADTLAEGDGGEVVCPEGGEPCAGSCCAAGEGCRYNLCVAIGVCDADEDCGSDSYCEDGACLPYGTGPRDDHNPDCTRVVIAGLFAPTLQCSWEGPPAGDAYPLNRHLLSTPMVVDFDFDDDPTTVRPSIVFTSDDGDDGGSEQSTGVIRIVNGRDCTQQASLDMQLTSHSSPPAVGDVDGDGRAEVVAFQAGGGLVAFHYLEALGIWDVLWRSHLADGSAYSPTGGGWTGPALHDLDDDGVSEVLRGGLIFAADGTLLGSSLGVAPDGGSHAGIGIFPVVADVDADALPELVTGAGVYAYDTTTHDWVREAYSVAGLTGGHAAVADFDLDGRPEVAVVTAGTVRIHTLESTVTFGPITLPGGGTGGPPTIADFDGDGFPEVASAGANAYAVFDPDCVPAPTRSGACAAGRTDGILWSSPTQDLSSNVTGSSVFDFEGDGPAEVVYADECFVRVYAGATGEVIFSQKSSSCTWYENPVVADVDGDFNAEIVVAANTNCGDPTVGRACSALEPGNIDPLFAGLHCDSGANCVSGICDAGLCRCTTTDECCTDGCVSTGYVCAAPPAGTPGAGNTCRASRPTGFAGLRVYRDAADTWVGSRPIWNQHPYHVTHVDDTGRVPRTSAVAVNWTAPGLNNFRQNVQGDPTSIGSPDLTSGRGDYEHLCDTGTRTIDLEVMICNRGTEPVGDGIVVTFYDGPPDAGGAVLCSTATDRALAPGECDPVSCPWVGVPDSPTDVYVDADPGAEERECVEGNNWTVIPGVRCEGIG
ncbi:MAG: VCBS repeat-containing protein [Deltaproteobacteria bacterium]|nr:VCBS repeat-containing protein [Deltaproteobacteria bacterium]